MVLGVKKISVKINHKQGWVCKKYKRARDENTRRLPYHRKVMVKKDWKTMPQM